MRVPLLDLKRQYESIRAEADAAVCGVLSSANYIMGENVRAFEKEFASYLGAGQAVAVGNGTDALVIALEALGVGPGDEVITSPYSFFSSAEAIALVGARPVFVDVRSDTYNIDETKIEAAITARTKAIMPVHIFGQCAEMDVINAVAQKHGLRVIEDACQAAGALYKGRKAGALADIACFSFFPTKNLGCAGDGGAIVTDSEELAVICRALHVHGSGENGKKAYGLLNPGTEAAAEGAAEDVADNTVYNPEKYYNYLIGHNSRLDELQAALLRIKLRHLDEYVENRRRRAAYYGTVLKAAELKLPLEAETGVHAYHQYVVLSEERDKALWQLKEASVAVGIYYPTPLHLQKAFSELGYKEGDMPNAEYLSKRMFALPMFPELTEEEQNYIGEVLCHG